MNLHHCIFFYSGAGINLCLRPPLPMNPPFSSFSHFISECRPGNPFWDTNCEEACNCLQLMTACEEGSARKNVSLPLSSPWLTNTGGRPKILLTSRDAEHFYHPQKVSPLLLTKRVLVKNLKAAICPPGRNCSGGLVLMDFHFVIHKLKCQNEKLCKKTKGSFKKNSSFHIFY